MSRTPNPWGMVPITADGQSLTDRAQAYVAELHRRGRQRDSVSKRHHYVTQGYLRAWSADGRRVNVVDTVAGTQRLQGLRDTCVKENFYQVHAPEGGTHNQVEEMFAVLDDELVRVVRVLTALQPDDDLAFEDFMSLGLMIILQRTRTPQSRRLMSAWNDWCQHQMAPHAEIAALGEDEQLTDAVDVDVHMDAVFNSMWKGADNLTTRTLELWDDPRARFVTCDAPVQVPHDRYPRGDLVSCPRIWWPIGPTRAVCLTNDPSPEKFSIKEADAAEVREINAAMVRGRERFLIATNDQLSLLPVGKKLPKRTQMWLRCEQQSERCRAENRECYAARPDIQMCERHTALSRPSVFA